MGPSLSAAYNHQINLAATEPAKQKGNWDAPMKYSKVLFEFMSSKNPNPIPSEKAGRSTGMKFTLKHSALNMWYQEMPLWLPPASGKLSSNSYYRT